MMRISLSLSLHDSQVQTENSVEEKVNPTSFSPKNILTQRTPFEPKTALYLINYIPNLGGQGIKSPSLRQPLYS